jgi:hypothetical protein
MVVYRPMMDSGSDTADGFAPLTIDAQRILSVLLAAQFPGSVQIAKQIESARGRVVDQEGSIVLQPSDSPRADVERRVPVEAEAVDADGKTFHVLLHVVDGYIAELEIYTEDGLPVRGPIHPEALRVLVLLPAPRVTFANAD